MKEPYGCDRDYEESDDEIAFRPVQSLSPVKNHFQAGESDRDQEDSDIVDLEFARSARRFHFAIEFRRIGNNPVCQYQRRDPDRDVKEEDPSPGKAIGYPAAAAVQEY
jgi:hypothetical protein